MKNDAFLHTIAEKKQKSWQGILRLKRHHLLFPLSKLIIPGSSSKRPSSIKINENRWKSMKINQTNQNRSKSIKKFDLVLIPGRRVSSELLQSDNSAGRLRPFIVRVCIAKGECDDCRRFEEDGGCNLMRKHEVKFGKASWHTPAIHQPQGVNSRSSFKVAPWDV